MTALVTAEAHPLARTSAEPAAGPTRPGWWGAARTAAVTEQCFVFLPYSYTARGPAESCAQIVRSFAEAGLPTTVFLPRRRRNLEGVRTVQTIPPVARALPWKMVRGYGIRSVERRFRAAIERADPRRTILYFWPDPPAALVEHAAALGFITVREMINTACDTSRRILNDAYAREGMPVAHAVTEGKVQREVEELRHYSAIFASNPEVERSLAVLGMPETRVLPTSFGWRPERFASIAPVDRPDRLRVAFVGSVGVRKGIADLLRAWDMAKIDGDLLIAGHVEADFQERFAPYRSHPGVTYLDYVEDVAALYRSCGLFVFPTLEEGGPQVTYEAAGCGLPVITTPMGAGRLVVDGETGLVVPPADPAALAGALRRLATDRDLRLRMGEQARVAADRFRYAEVGRQRADYLIELLRRHKG